MNKEKFEEIESQISKAAKASGRRRDQVKIIAVTKGFSKEIVREAVQYGYQIFGENYVQEFLPKKNDLADLSLEWHFIGHLQSNKVKYISNEVEYIHSVDRIKILTELNNSATKRQKILLEVNLAEESTKSGIKLAELPELIEKAQLYQNVTLCGLMFMAPYDLSEGDQKKYFSKALELREKFSKSVSSPHHLIELSMGTSHDFESAIEFGATFVRLGTAIFGERKYE